MSQCWSPDLAHRCTDAAGVCAPLPGRARIAAIACRHNPNTDATYGLRVVDADTIEAFKPFVESSGLTRLDLISASTAAAIEADDGDSDGIGSLAEQYEAMAKSDSANAHVWSACAAAAYARSTSNEAEFAEYVGLLVQMLKPIMASAGGTPCADAIPANLW